MEGKTNAGQPPTLTMPEKRNLAAVSDVLPFWNTGDIPGVLNFYEEDILWTNVAMEEVYRGHEGVGGYIQRMLTAFPDLRFDVSHKIPRDLRVAERWVISGTHLGPYLGIPATGRRVNIQGMSIVNLPEGRFLSDRFYFDTIDVLRQMGLAPPQSVFKAPPGQALLSVMGSVSRLLPQSPDSTHSPVETVNVDDERKLSADERSNLAVLTLAVDAFNRGSYDVLRGLFARNVTVDNKMFVGPQIGIETLTKSVDAVATGFPYGRVDITQTLVRGGQIACEFRLSGRHDGPFLGVPATGRSISLPAISMLTIDNGQISEVALYADSGMLWRQLGLMPPLSFLDSAAARVLLWVAVNRVRVIGLVIGVFIMLVMSGRRKR